jgi:hypothetical protein
MPEGGAWQRMISLSLFEIVESSESRATPHSIRSASSGSIAEARRAGK